MKAGLPRSPAFTLFGTAPAVPADGRFWVDGTSVRF